MMLAGPASERSKVSHTLEGSFMLRTVTIALATTALAAAAAAATHGAPAKTLIATAQAAAAGGAQYGTFGFDAAGMDRTVLPGDDFYQYANCNWAMNTRVPPDKSNYCAFSMI